MLGGFSHDITTAVGGGWKVGLDNWCSVIAQYITTIKLLLALSKSCHYVLSFIVGINKVYLIGAVARLMLE